VVGPDLLLLVVNEHDEAVEECRGNGVGDDGSNGERAVLDLPEDGGGNSEAHGGDGEGQGELLENLGLHFGSFLHY
jgi:hypothetical protein